MGDKMEKKIRDEDWERLLEEQYLKEADLIEEEFFSDDFEEFEDETEEEKDAAYEELVERLKESGDYREDDERKDERKRRVSFRTVRAAGFVAVCVLGVFAASMTSEANRKYFIKNMYYLTGNDTKPVIDNDETNENANENEKVYKVRRDIQEKLDIEIPELFYAPKGFIYYDYNANEANGVVQIEYLYKEKIVALVCWKKDDRKNSTNFSLHGNIKSDGEEQCTNEFANVNINVSEIREEGDKESSYLAQWEYKDVFYQLSGKIEREEFFKILKSFNY